MYLLAAIGKLWRGDFISPAVAIMSSGAKVKGNADRTQVESRAKNLPVFPVSKYVFAAPGFFQYLVKSATIFVQSRLRIIPETKTVVIGTTTKEEHHGKNEKTGHHDNLCGSKPGIRVSNVLLYQTG